MIPSLAAVGKTSEPSNRAFWKTLAIHATIATIAATVFLASVGWAYEPSLVEKMLSRSAMPTAIVWYAILIVGYVSWVRGERVASRMLLFVAMLYWLSSATFASQRYVESLERPFQRVSLATTEPFDVIVVLGGGTRSNGNGDAWLGPGGERVHLAAEFYHQGKVKRLVTTGRQFDWMGPRAISMAEATTMIWRRLNIPHDVIVPLGGRNTAEEMQELRRLLADQPGQRVGLITSAYHLPRALRLARAQQLEVIPIPADFMTRLPDPWPLAIIPTSYGFADSDTALREYLAAVVDR